MEINEFFDELPKNGKKQKKFNIFDITDISAKEVYICKVLAELLNPRGSHNNEEYFNLFKELLSELAKDQKIDIPKDFEKIINANTTIDTENLTKYNENDNRRRMDIIIHEADGYYLPIEVKINAGEQKEQCCSYLKNVQNYYKKCKMPAYEKKLILCFLTKDGHKPESIKEGQEKNIICISWKNIAFWIDECVKVSAEPSVCEILKQLLKIIKEYEVSDMKQILEYTHLDNYYNIEEITELSKAIENDKDKLEMALKLYPAYLYASQNIWKTFYNELIEEFKNNFEKYEVGKKSSEEWYIEVRINGKKIYISSEARTEQSKDRLPYIIVCTGKKDKKTFDTKIFDLINEEKRQYLIKEIIKHIKAKI